MKNLFTFYFLLFSSLAVFSAELNVDILCLQEDASCNGIGPNNGLFQFEVNFADGAGGAADLFIYQIVGDDTTATITESITTDYTSDSFPEGGENYSIRVIDTDDQEYQKTLIAIECTSPDNPTGQSGMTDFPTGVQEVCFGEDAVITADCVYIPANDYSTASYVLYPFDGVLPDDAIAWSDDGTFPFSLVEEAGLIGMPLVVSGVIGWNESAAGPNVQPEGIIDYEGLTPVFFKAQGETIINNGIDALFSCGEEVMLYAPPGAEVIEWSTGETTDTIFVSGDTGWNDYWLHVLADDGCTWIDSTAVYFDDSCVWPGDANYDGVADNYDLLALGRSFGATGPARNDASIDYVAQAAADWTGSFDDGTNYKHSDCNGDGVVGKNDVQAILENYDMTHERPQGGAPAGDDDPPLMFILPDEPVQAGTTVEFPIVLGSEALPAADIYGLAFTVQYNNVLFQEGTIEITFLDSWMGDPEEDVLQLSREDYVLGLAQAAATRTDQMNVSGQGIIAIFSGILIEEIETKQAIDIDLELSFINVNLISTEEEFLPVFVATQSLTIFDIAEGIVENSANTDFTIYPNPAQNYIKIDLAETIEVEEIELIALDGSTAKLFRGNQSMIEVNDLAAGIYFLQIKTDQGILARKIQIQ